MKNLIVYDLNGVVLLNIKGSYEVPNGVPYIEVVVPEGKYVESINVETKEPVYADIPKTEIQILEDKISILEAQNKDLENALVELASMVGGA